MDRDVNVALDQQVVDGLGVLVLASIGGTENGADTNGVLVDQVDGLLRVDNVAILCAVDIPVCSVSTRTPAKSQDHGLLLNIKVTSSLLPTHLNSRVHDDVRTRVVLALCLALVDPGLLHCQCCKHDGLG